MLVVQVGEGGHSGGGSAQHRGRVRLLPTQPQNQSGESGVKEWE